MPQINIDPQGTIRVIYDDMWLPLLQQGQSSIARVSSVEPDVSGGWSADLAPVNGPKLGPYLLRQTALDAEIDYLNSHVL